MKEPARERLPAHRDGPSFAVAFGGGGARGLAHIHVVETLDELGIRPVVIAGSSIGAIIGAGMAAGMSGKDIRAYARSVLTRRSEVASRMWKSRPDSFREMLEGGFRLGQFNVERILKAFLPPEIPVDFSELQIPLKVAATDFFGHDLAVLEKGNLHSALAASAAIPALFRPVSRDGRLYIDGGIYNPVPFDTIWDMADIIIAIDVVGVPVAARGRRLSGIELVFGASQLMMQSITAMKLTQRCPEIFLKPPVSGFRVLDFLKIESVLAETAPIREELRRAIDKAVAKAQRR